MHSSSDLGLEALADKHGFTSNMDMYGRSKTCNIAGQFRDTLRQRAALSEMHPIDTCWEPLSANWLIAVGFFSY